MHHFSAFRRRAHLLLTGLALTTFAAQAQIGIGTTQPNPKAALDIRAIDKGLLIPRLDSAQRAAIASPPDGLMVFQKNGRAGLWYAFGGTWLYIPDKVRANDNLGNHTATRPLNLGANALVGNGGSQGLRISSTGNVGIGTTAPRGKFDVDGPGDTYLVDDPNSGSQQNAYLPGHLFLAPRLGTSGTAYVQARVPNPSPTTNIGLTLRTTEGGGLHDGLVIAPSGDVTVPGQLSLGWTQMVNDFSLSGGARGTMRISCPNGTRLMGGGGGHRDDNGVSRDITVNYSGPDPNNPAQTWRLNVNNTSSSSRAVRVYCMCARMQ